MNEQLDHFDTAEPHPIFSAIIDLYLLELFVGVISSSVLYFIDFYLLGVVFLLLDIILLITVIIYHAVFAKKIMWVSPGEIIGGKLILDKEKVWTNPYGVNRIGLFLICVLSLLLFRKSNAMIGGLTSISDIIGFFIKTLIVTCSIVLIGKGKLIGIALINSFLLLSFGLSMFVKDDSIRVSGYFSLVFFVAFTIIGIIYYKIRIDQNAIE